MPINKEKATASLNAAGTRLISELAAAAAAADAIATGKTVQSLAYAISFKPGIITFQLTGGPGWAFIEQGRGPTQNEGDGAVLRAIKEWVKARGIPDAMAYPITKKIHKEGTRLYRDQIRRDIYSSIITREGVERIANNVGILGTQSITSEIVNALKP